MFRYLTAATIGVTTILSVHSIDSVAVAEQHDLSHNAIQAGIDRAAASRRQRNGVGAESPRDEISEEVAQDALGAD